MENLPVSVITIARNSEDTIRDCLESVRNNHPAEIIIVDGNSTDKTVEIARDYTDRIYSDEGKGLAYARQLGAEMATQEYVAYVDSDVTLTDSALATMLSELQDSGDISISARPLPGENNISYWSRASYQHLKYSVIRRRQQYLSTMACLIKREIVTKYRFDTSGYLDDTLLEAKLKKDGYRLGISSVIVYHNHEDDFRNFVRYRFFLGRLTPSVLAKEGLHHIEYCPPLVMLYWLGFCLVRWKPRLVPYFVMSGVAGTTGMVKGLFDLVLRGRKW
jgi:glycosyltransferase involved in cell wall biosynthesis